MCSLTRLDKLDEVTIDVASNMLESNLRHVVFAGTYALSTLDSISDHTLRLVDRGFVRALQACDYEFVELFAMAYRRWLDNSQSHVEELLSDSPEYLPVALDRDSTASQSARLDRVVLTDVRWPCRPSPESWKKYDGPSPQVSTACKTIVRFEKSSRSNPGRPTID